MREKKDLTHKDILTLIDKSVSRNAVYVHLNTLLEKGAIKIGPSVRCGRTYGRTFSPTISKEEYAATQVKDCIVSDEHTLRDSYATMLFECGIEVKDAQDLLGHSTIAMTQDVYTHIGDKRKEDTAALLNKQLAKLEKKKA